MTGRERILTTLAHKEPDMVPIFDWSINPFVVESLTGYRSDMRFVEEFDLDAISVRLVTNRKFDTQTTYFDDFGVLRAVSAVGDYDHPIKNVIDEPEELKSYKMPDPDADHLYRRVREAQDYFGKEKAIFVHTRDVFSFARDMLGFENLFIDLYEEPELVHELISMQVEYSTKVAKNLRSMGIEIIDTQDDIATARGLFISKEMYCSFFQPHYKELVQNFKKEGLWVAKHSDGDLRSIVPELLDAGIDILDPIDPMGHMDLAEMKRLYGDRVTLKGNVDCVGALVTGTLEDVERVVKGCIDAAAGGGGYILSSSNSIHSSINPQNYKYMIECARKYGKY